MLLNVRSVYSLLSSTLKIEAYVTKAKELGYQAIGLADDQVLHGALQFYLQAKQHNLKPLIGLKVSLIGVQRQNQRFPFLLYARNYTGYQHLLKISRLCEQPQGQPNNIWQYLREEAKDLVYISLGRYSELEQAIIHEDFALAEKIYAELVAVFGRNNVYMGFSIYPYNETETNLLNQYALKHSIPQVMTQLVNTLNDDEAFSLKILKAIKDNDTLDESIQRMKGTNYLFSQQALHEMYHRAGLKHIYDTTEKLVAQLNVELKTDQAYLPKYQTPNGISAQQHLHKLTHQALIALGEGENHVYKERLNYELNVIDEMGFSDYFLIVWEIISYCHQNDIRVGPGRGSAAGSLVSYLLKITLVDPVKHNLLFERFLNPERQSMPDIDIDIADAQRDRVLNFIRENYGYEQVAQIATMGTFGAKQAIRDTLRVLNANSDELRRWSRAIPSDQNQLMTLERAYKLSESLRNIIAAQPRNQEIFKAALTIEGIPRHISTHAAAVVIHDEPLVDIIPVKDRENDLLLTQFTMYDIEKIGLLKMDFLGLRNLTILSDILTNLKRNKAIDIDVSSLPLDDQKTLALFQTGDTNGVFQFESDGIKNVLQKLHPESFEDIVAVNALYRPGPMKQIDSFINRKQGREEITYIHPVLEPILSNTYGIIVYQEQVMQIVVNMAGFSLGEADLLRRAMGKKQADVMEEERQHFIAGALRKGHQQAHAEEVYSYIYEFSNYGFNRAHAVVYSTLAYQLAYLKAHFPAEFYQAILNNGRSQTTSYMNYVQEAKKRLGQIAPLDINLSLADFSVDKQLRVGFNSVKGIRKELIQHIIENRSLAGAYKNFINFLHRLPMKFLNSDSIEPLIYAGAFDNLGYNRATLIHNLPTLLQSVEYSGQSMSLFQEMEPKIEWLNDYSILERLNKEKEVLGFTLSGHPLDAYDIIYNTQRGFVPLEQFSQDLNRRYIKTIGLINSTRVIRTKNDDLMAFVQVSNELAEETIVVFPDSYPKIVSQLKENHIIAVEGRIDRSRQQPQIIAQKIYSANQLLTTNQPQSYTQCFIRIEDFKTEQAKIDQLKRLGLENPGPCTVIIVDRQRQSFKLDSAYSISYSLRVQGELKSIFGEKNVVFQ